MHIQLFIDSYTVTTLLLIEYCTNFNPYKPSTGEYPCVYSREAREFLASDSGVIARCMQVTCVYSLPCSRAILYLTSMEATQAIMSKLAPLLIG